jgi:hypothetical protein
MCGHGRKDKDMSQVIADLEEQIQAERYRQSREPQERAERALREDPEFKRLCEEITVNHAQFVTNLTEAELIALEVVERLEVKRQEMQACGRELEKLITRHFYAQKVPQPQHGGALFTPEVKIAEALEIPRIICWPDSRTDVSERHTYLWPHIPQPTE